ncbi:MAG: biotin--[acetyl-CoA-carboxylase] ligase [Treponema sp.]|jgi:BirA family biotin operon repressor/biotin-[acetyl-CoA-carboxylase] ligase|nr:biotin--[acetyl-CoA-carboxylase] ligase [Treponema sp.]
MMVNRGKKGVARLSTKAKILMALREQTGKTVSGSKLASDLGISRVGVWKGIQSLITAGYLIKTNDTGYFLDPARTNDFLYPWEFGEKEPMFRFFENTASTMDNVRDFASQGHAAGTVAVAETQSAGRGRNGRTWASRQGGLYCSFLDRPALSLADYCMPAMLYQIAVARAVGSICGKPAKLRWPNDIYIGGRKIAGIITELEAEGDMISWIATGIGVNVNNLSPSAKAVSCCEITRRTVSRRTLLISIINEADRLKKSAGSTIAYTQGSRYLAAEWNSLADSIGAKTAIVDSVNTSQEPKGRLLARGVFEGIDPAGRCIVKPHNNGETLYFNPGPVSMMFLQN